MVKTLISIFFLISLTSYAVDEAKEITISQKNGVEFRAETNIFVTVKGYGPILDGKVKLDKDLASGEFSIQLDQFKTDDEARDKHLQETFDVKKHPLAVLKFENVRFKDGNFSFKGDLSIKGKSKESKGSCFKKSNNIACNFIVKQSDYGLKIPESIATKLGAKVDDEIKVKVNFNI